MPDTTGVSGATASSSRTGTIDDAQRAFRQADFLKIMLTEITHQSPFDPQDTGALVENMQKLQELANTTYTKFRDDIRWAQQLMDQQVSVQQMSITPAEKEALRNKGLNPDVGYAQVRGTVTSFRIVEESVYITVDGKDYPLDNVKQIVPVQDRSQALAAAADQLLGKQVVFHRASVTDVGHGAVSSVAYDEEGRLILEVGEEAVPFANVTQIGVR